MKRERLRIIEEVDGHESVDVERTRWIVIQRGNIIEVGGSDE